MVLNMAPYTRPVAGPLGMSGPNTPKSAGRNIGGEAFLGQTRQPSSLSEESTDIEESNEKILFHLAGVIVHKGEASHGHYYCIVKEPKSGSWYKLDDEKVTLFSEDKIPEECFGGCSDIKNR